MARRQKLSKNIQTLPLRLEPELKEQVREAAEQDERSMTSWVVVAIKEKLERLKQE